MSRKFYVIVALVLMAFVTFQFWILSESKRLEIRNEIAFLKSQAKVIEFLIKRNKEAARKRPKVGGETRKEIETWTKHKVSKGDNIYSITQKYLVRKYQIYEWNGLKPGCLIHPGQIIRIKKIKWPSYIGKASWYGPGFHGKPMANTEKYDMNQILVAHRHYPIGLKVRVTNLKTGKSIIAPVLDRGPYAKDKNGKYIREIDLSYKVARLLGAIEPGVIPVKIEPIES